MRYYCKEYANSVIDDRMESLIDQYCSQEKEQDGILQLGRDKKNSSKLLPLYALVIILALYVCVNELPLQQWAMLITYVLIALTYGVMAIGYYHEYM